MLESFCVWTSLLLTISSPALNFDRTSTIQEQSPTLQTEQKFRDYYSRQIDPMPEFIVTPRRVYSRYLLAGWYYFFSKGHFIFKSRQSLPQFSRLEK